ncbi:RNB domain-containing ribonuclease [Nocardia sp. CDC159]|uniref:RNB domain-containing ribonuclease n=1 Tax=Nocardia pulmonis TaxID=2951408 RepID=A0A9X2E426_9NOCA|nr:MULTISPECIES: RNB domain-containing ribonuclease [Nocardia]MCM6773464.1 RNB domain-containing ribonuclease [Nocardia pulmonis]MCM6786351.1 RNB domain-containing ribonuclease [Nocardia sp. CDC159]
MELHQRIVSAPVDFGAVRSEFGMASEYPSEAVSEARDAVDAFAGSRADRRDIPLVTIDPPGALDLDQALYLERTSSGFLLQYAIADVAAVVAPDGALARESLARGQTFYLPDGTVPLHPPVLSEGSASLLPDQDRPAALWTIECDETGEPQRFSVRRALVRSRARLDYAGVQADADAGRLHPSIAALPEFGRLRIESGLARGAIGLRLPAQTVVRDGHDDGAGQHWQLVLEPRTAADDWNEQVSLLTGMCAARIMLGDAGPGRGHRIGVLRTMPPPSEAAVESMRRTAAALGVDWPTEVSVGRMLAGLDPNTPAALVLMSEATGLLRGATYTVLGDETPPVVEHSAIGAPYAHVTAPLRRLADRYATEICLARCAGEPVPRWVRDGLEQAAESMRRSDAVAGKLERACIDLTESTVLADRLGSVFRAVVVREANGSRPAEIFVADPPVVGKCVGSPPEGWRVRVRLVESDPAKRTVTFAFPAD